MSSPSRPRSDDDLDGGEKRYRRYSHGREFSPSSKPWLKRRSERSTTPEESPEAEFERLAKKTSRSEDEKLAQTQSMAVPKSRKNRITLGTEVVVKPNSVSTFMKTALKEGLSRNQMIEALTNLEDSDSYQEPETPSKSSPVKKIREKIKEKGSGGRPEFRVEVVKEGRKIVRQQEEVDQPQEHKHHDQFPDTLKTNPSSKIAALGDIEKTLVLRNPLHERHRHHYSDREVNIAIAVVWHSIKNAPSTAVRSLAQKAAHLFTDSLTIYFDKCVSDGELEDYKSFQTIDNRSMLPRSRMKSSFKEFMSSWTDTWLKEPRINPTPGMIAKSLKYLILFARLDEEPEFDQVVKAINRTVQAISPEKYRGIQNYFEPKLLFRKITSFHKYD